MVRPVVHGAMRSDRHYRRGSTRLRMSGGVVNDINPRATLVLSNHREATGQGNRIAPALWRHGQSEVAPTDRKVAGSLVMSVGEGRASYGVGGQQRGVSFTDRLASLCFRRVGKPHYCVLGVNGHNGVEVVGGDRLAPCRVHGLRAVVGLVIPESTGTYP